MTSASAATPPYQIRVRDANMKKTGEIGRAISLQLTPRYIDVGGFSLTVPSMYRNAALLTPGSWLEFLSNGNSIMAGQIRGIKEVRDKNNLGGTLTVYGPSAEQVIADRLAFPVPSSPATSQSASDYDRRTGAAETVIKGYVDANAGPSAISARRVPKLVMETDAGRGGTVKASARMDNLLALIIPLAQSGGVGFQVKFVGDVLMFCVYEPTDRSATAKFGMDLGNLESFERTREAARSSVAIVGGSGDGTARVFREVLDASAISTWSSRSETFVDRRDSSDSAEMDQAGTEEVVTNGMVTGISIKTVDTPNLMFYRDYYLGDKVSVPDTGVSDILREIELNWNADNGPSAQSTVGTAALTGSARMIRRLAYLNYLVEKLQSKK